MSGHVEFVVDKLALGQVFSKYVTSSVKSHSTNFTFMTIYDLALAQLANSGRSTKLVQSYPHPKKTKKLNLTQ
jgi:hypothetical protein